MDDIRRMLDRLSELTNDELDALEDSIINEFGTVEAREISRESVADMTFLADSVETVRSERAKREAEKLELASQASDAAARVTEQTATTEELPAEEPEEEKAEEEEPPEEFAAKTVTAATDAPTEAVVESPVEAVAAAVETEAVTETPAAAEAAAVEPEAAEAATIEPEVTEAAAVAPEVTEAAVAAPEAAEAAAVEPEAAEAAPVTEAATLDPVVTEANTVTDEEEEAPPIPDALLEEIIGEVVTDSLGGEEAPDGEIVPVEGILVEPHLEPPLEENLEEEIDQALEDEEPLFAAREEGNGTESVEAQMGNTAAGPETFSAPADRLPNKRESLEPTPITLIAGGDIPGITAGSQLDGAKGLAEAIGLRLHTLRRASGGHGDHVVVASLIANYPEDRTLRGNELDSNNAKIKAVTKPEVIVASGGYCAPLPVNYDIFDIGGSTDTPLKDSLPVFNADRGGIRYIAPPVFDYSGAIGIWTEQDDIDAVYPPVQPGPPTTPTKPCMKVECAQETEEYLDAITMCLCFGNLQTRAFPELIDLHNQLVMVEMARFTELYILEQIKAGSTIISIPAVLGTARDVLIAVERAATAYRHQFRLDPDLPLRFVAPQWLHAMIRSDLTAQLPGDGMETTFNVSTETINSFFKERNINPVWTLEGIGDQPTYTDYPDHVEWALFSEGTWTLLDGGTLDIGLVRDMELVSTNDYCMFSESFMNVAKTGLESIWAGQFLNVNGGSAGTLDVAAVDY